MPFNNRKFSLYIALLAVIVLGVPYSIGFWMKTQLLDVLQVLKDSHTAQIECTEYHNGWFRSTAKTRMALSNEKMEVLGQHLEPITVVLTHHIYHGPFAWVPFNGIKKWHFGLATMTTNLELSAENKKKLPASLSNVQWLHALSEIRFDGVFSTQFFGEGFEIKEKGIEPLYWKGLHGSFFINAAKDHFSGKMILPGADLESKGKRYIVENWVFKTDKKRTKEGLWIGDEDFFLEGFRFIVPGQPPIAISQLHSDHVLRLNPLVQGKLHISFEKAQYNNLTYGPFKIAAVWDKFSPSFIRAFLDWAVKNGASDASVDSKAQYAEILQILSENLPELLKNNPSFKIEQTLDSSIGGMNTYLDFSIGGDSITDYKNKAQIMRTADLTLEFKISQRMLIDWIAMRNPEDPNAHQKAHDDVTQWVRYGLLSVQGNDYVCKMGLKKGVLNLNGSSEALTLPS